MSRADALYAAIKHLVDAGTPAPSTDTIMKMSGITNARYYLEATAELKADGRVRIQYKTTNAQRLRSFVLQDGRRTPFPTIVRHSAKPVIETHVRASLTQEEAALIADAVAAGKVTRCPSAYNPQGADFYRKVML